jgi:MFS transporter, DHA1 family, multidrug resistance protein
MQDSAATKYNLMFLLFFIPFLMGTNVDLYVPSLPTIAHYFNTSSSLVQLSISFYILSYALGQLVLGVLSDSFGRRKILLISGLFYTAVSFLSVFAPNIYVLILCRFLQGLGVAGLGVVIRAVAMDRFSGLALTKAMNYVSISWSLGPIVGPFIGGYLQHYFNWQADFYFFGVYGLVMFIAVFALLPETLHDLVPLDAVKISKTVREILFHPVFFLTAMVAAIIYALVVIFNMIGPFLIQTVLKYSVVAYGRAALLLGFCYFLGNIINRVAINYFKPMRVVLFAMIAALLVSVLMVTFGVFTQINLYVILIPTALLFFLCGFIVPNLMGRYGTIFPKNSGTVSAISGLLVAGGSFLITSFATLFKTNNQMPLASMYIVILLVSLILLMRSRRLECRARCGANG